MRTIRSNIRIDEDRLGELVMKFRSTRQESERQVIAQEYSEVVDRLITSGSWHEMPAPEDQLPDDWMPGSFHEFWSLPNLS